jgi:hypothetical protein
MSYVVFGEFHKHISTTTLDRKYEEYIKASGVKKYICMTLGTRMLVI